ncbi:type I restriction endonuclease subunit R [Mordavella massiliensis]|uniref:DEAD/DEAH box helicase family protein n=1 Tax=Mordavella massiliensis TaxID=1871024 RepID=A0A938X240_9CLOT|nr:type I restriction endonuclease subunit R [Mordavella massiliensis]MBM6827836.1 DEAD/DEAH box helicase family protein [Mordavella massiliensis]
MLPEEKARVKIDKQLRNAGWDIVSRNEYLPNSTVAVKEALMVGNTESDYLLFIEGKAIAVIEAKREENPLGDEVKKQVENYAVSPQAWYALWFEKLIPLVYMANGNKIYFKNMLNQNSRYEELSKMHSPKKMLQIVQKKSEYGALPLLEKRGLRDCQYKAELEFEESLKHGKKKNLAVLATGSGKTYLACLASYRLLNYTSTRRILFLVDRNNLARQTEIEFSLFDKTEKQQKMGVLYSINRLKKETDIKSDIVISTIQKLFAVLTGQAIQDGNEDVEDEIIKNDEEKDSNDIIELGDNLQLPSDYFQFIIVDECHRSIYGKWKKVLDYFSSATVLGLTATPTPEAYAFFNNNIIEQYTYDDSVVDGVNVPPRIYRIITDITAHVGTIERGSKVGETAKRTGKFETHTVQTTVEYGSVELDRSVVNKNQIKEVLMAYKRAIYEDLYPEREKKWEYIPKTLIFAKDDNHATEIVDIAKEVFKTEFDNDELPENFVQKITYSAGNSNVLIRDLRTEKDFRIAVTVTLVATGTDIKPLEVVLFMKDVHSDVLYTQMKGRGCRVISDDKLKEVTPNADTKECYYIVDAVGVTESEKHIPKPSLGSGSNKHLSLEHVLERLAHNELSDDNLILLRDYCSTINRRYEESVLFGRHLDYFVTNYGFTPRKLANDITSALVEGTLMEYVSPSHDNTARRALVYCLIGNLQARNKLLEMQRGYMIESDDKDQVLYAGFSKESAKTYIENFEKYLEEHKDDIEALRIIYNSEDTIITHDMLMELRDRLLSESRQYGVYQIWKNYKLLDEQGDVEILDGKANVNVLTNLIQIVRYAYKKNQKLTSLINGYAQRFSLYCGRAQRVLTEDQKDIMKQIAEYIINDGAISAMELNETDTELWKRAVKSFGGVTLASEIQTLAKFILKVTNYK